MELLTLFFGTLRRQTPVKFNYCLTADEHKFNLKLNILRQLAAKKIGDEETIILIEKSLICLKQILSFAPEYDFQNVPANGFRSLLLIGLNTVAYGVENWCEGDESFANEFRTILKCHLNGFHYVKRIRQITKHSGENVIWDRQFLCEMYLDFIKAEPNTIGPLYSKFAGLMHGSHSLNRMATKMYLSWTFLKNPTPFLPVKYLLESDYFLHRMDELMRCVKITDLSFVEYIMPRSLARTTFSLFGPSVSAFDVHVPPSQFVNEYVIKVDHDECTIKIGCQEGRKVPKIRCLVVRKNKEVTWHEPFAGDILIYMHGGAWTVGQPEYYMGLLPKWAHAMPGLTIVAPEQLQIPENQFPSQNQRFLDFYMWLVKCPKEELQSVLGLSKISSIILAGDSSGGNNALSLTYVLNDIRNGFNCHVGVPVDENIRMPTSLHLYFPAVMMCKAVSASVLTMPHHWVLTPMTILSVLVGYVPQKVAYKEYTSMANSGKDREKNLSRMPELLNDWIMEHPYATNNFYENFSTLKSVGLHVMAVPSDFWIDYIIDILKKWQGEVSLSTVEDLPHAFLCFPFIGLQYNQAADFLGEKLRLDFLSHWINLN